MPPRVVDPLGREAARRRAVDTLRVAEAIARYGAEAVADGLGPEEARRAVVEAAAELETIAGALRRLARSGRLDPAGRRAVVVQLAADGWSQRRIAAAVGVSKRTVWDDLHDRSLAAAPVTPARLGSGRGARLPAQGGP